MSLDNIQVSGDDERPVRGKVVARRGGGAHFYRGHEIKATQIPQSARFHHFSRWIKE